MLTAYIFCLAVGGGFLGLSLFGDFLDADVDIDADVDVDIGGGVSDVAHLLSLRTFVYALFGFGAAGAALHTVWDGAQPVLTAGIAVGTGLLSGAFISTVFGYLKRSDTGPKPGEESFIGSSGEVSMAIDEGALGYVSVQRGDRRFRIRARLADVAEQTPIPAGNPVVVVGMEDGIAVVSPVDLKLLDE